MLRGKLDMVTRARIAGWAWDDAAPDRPVTLLVTVNEALLARIVAREWREDLAVAGIGAGAHAFAFRPGAALPVGDQCLIAVTEERGGIALPGSPVVLPPASAFDETAREAFAALLALADDAGAAEARIRYLAEQTRHLLRMRAGFLGGHPAGAARRFAWRWADTEGRGEPDEGRKADRSAPRALVIDETTPTAGSNAGANVIVSHMVALRRLRFEVAFTAADMPLAATPDDRPGFHHESGAKMLAALGVTPRAAPWYGSIEEVLRLEAGCFDLVYLHRLSVAARYLPLVRFHQPQARVVFSVADLSSVRLARQAKIEDRPELLIASQGRRTGERIAAGASDAVLTHSTMEAEFLARDGVPSAKIHRVRWSVTPRPTPAAFRDRKDLAFVGGYAHAPNVDAAFWLVETIMPLVWAEDPTIACLLAGSAMPDGVRALARPRVEILGHVLDLETMFDRVRLTVAPLRFGAGAKGKVIDSFAAGIPCAGTLIAAEGLDLPAALLAFFADAPELLARRILLLHADNEANLAAARAGLDYVADAFSEQRLDADLGRALAVGCR